MPVCLNCGSQQPDGVAFCNECGTTLRGVTSAVSSAISLTQPAPQIQNFEPETLLPDRYKIVKAIARGGQSVVYLAKDIRLQGRPVVIKELRIDLLPPNDREPAISRFEGEAVILARLGHANLPAVSDFFLSKNRGYLVMEYIDGRTLQTIIDESPEPISEGQVIEWAQQLCNVLSYMHSQSPPIIFRDLKPGNVMVSTDNVIKLIDFDIARVFKAGKRHDTTPFGTTGYASPEQYGAAQTDARSDIYSLGITLYVLLTKYDPMKHPFNLPPLRNLNSKISPATEATIHRAIQPRRDKRFQSVSEMWNALAVGSLRLVERHPDWPAWEQAIQQSLAKAKRVRTAQLSLIPNDFRSSAVERYVALHPEQDISHSADFKYLWLDRFSDWRAVDKQWQKARRLFDQSYSPSSISQMLRGLAGLSREDAVEEVIKKLQGLIPLQRVGDRVDQGRLSVYSWDVEPILAEVRIAPILPLAVLRGSTLLESDLEDLRDVLGPKAKGASRIAFLLLFMDGRDLQRSRQLLNTKMKQAYFYDVIPLACDELFRIATAKDPQQAFRSIILAQVDLMAISPFVITGPTVEYNFFGREQELQTIVEHVSSASFVIIGGRRVGKTSILSRLHHVRLPAADFRTLYYDCSTTPTYDAFLAANICDYWRPEPPADAPTTFGDLFQSPPDDKSLVLLLDEADKLVPADHANGWPLFTTLRALANSGRAQVVLSGARTLRTALRDSSSPLFNFTNEICLGPLGYRAVEELVTRPMKQLEIELVDEKAIVDRIWAFTSGHPNVAQRLCHRLIERLNEQGTRSITMEDVNAVIENPQFQEIDFLQTYWESATPLEKIVSLLMADDEDARTLIAVRQALADRCNLLPKAHEVDDALQRLVDLRSILARTPRGYIFALKSFPRVVAGTMTLRDMLEILKEDYTRNEA